jgi:hypothetical protein
MLWPFSINWRRDPIERLEWLTSIVVSQNDTEDAVSVRTGARRFLNVATVVAGDDERVLYENTVIAGQADSYDLPLFMDAAFVTEAVADVDVEIAVDSTVGKSFSIGAEVVLLSEGSAAIETVESIEEDSITLAGAPGEFPVGTKIIPLVKARIQAAQPLTYLSDGVMTADVEFSFDDEWIGSPASESADYRGCPVFIARTDWGENRSAQIARNIHVFDNVVGKPGYRDKAGVHRARYPHRWVLEGRQELAEFRAWIAARRGRYAPFWAPSNLDDFKVTGNIGSAATSITVANRKHAMVAGEVGRRDIMIELHNGTRYYRRITDIAPSGTTETLTIDSALGANVAASDIARVSYMRLMRLASDTVEIAYKKDDVAIVKLNFMSKRDSDDE